MEPAAKPRRRWAWLAALVVLYAALRLALVVSLADVFFYGEELAKGAMAKAFLDGLDAPKHALSYRYFEGGSFVSTHLTAITFWIVGESLLALKLTAIASGIAVLAAGWLALERPFGLRAANVFGLLFVFAPATFQSLSLLNLGHHFESSFFLFGLLWAVARIVSNERASPWAWFALGSFGGAGTYYNLWIAVSFAVSLGLIALLRPRALLPGRAWPALVGLALGAAPLFWMLGRVGFGVLDIHGTDASRPSNPSDGGFIDCMLSIWRPADALDRSVMLLGVAIPLAAPLLAWRLKMVSWRLAVALAFWLLALLGSYLASPFVVGEATMYFYLARLAPIWALGTALTAATLGSLLGRSRATRRVAALCMLVFLLDGGRDFWVAVRNGRSGDGRGAWATLNGTKGYDYTGYIVFVAEHLEEAEPKQAPIAIARTFLGYDEPHPEYLHSRIALDLFWTRFPSLERAVRAAGQIGIDDPRGLILGLGRVILKRGARTTPAALNLVARYPEEELRPLLAEAFGRTGLRLRVSPDAVRGELEGMARSQQQPLVEAWLRGVGSRVHECFLLDRAAAMDFIAEQPEWMHADLHAGFEHALHLRRLP